MGATEYVELGRRFLEHTGGERSGDPATRQVLEMAHVRGHTALGWEELLRDRCVVVLGDPQSGKTTEFRQQARERGEHAWFLTVSELAREVLLPEGRLANWKASEEDGWFFLDSVDEAEQSDPMGNPLERALRRLARELGEAWPRARVRISSRVSDWRHDEQVRVLDDFFPAQETSDEGKKKKKPAWRVVELMPLSDAQVQALVGARRAREDATRFLEAVQLAGASELVRRPGDVGWMLAHWERHDKLGALHEILASAVSELLRESNEGRERCEPAAPQAMERAAERVAAATYLCGQERVVLPDLHEAGVEARVLFRDQDIATTRTLLGRALFDVPIRGMVRFHHRALREYLAARWLRAVLARGQRFREVRRLLVVDTGGGPVVPRALEPVAAWLAGWNTALAEELVELAPDALLRYGDPSLLPERLRGRAVRRYVELYTEHPRRVFPADEAALRRVASPQLGAVLLEVLERGAAGRVPVMVLDLVRLGSCEECLEVSVARALDVEELREVRMAAVRAAHALVEARPERAEDFDRMTAGLIEQAASSAEVLAVAVGLGFPERVDAEGLKNALVALCEGRVMGAVWAGQLARWVRRNRENARRALEVSVLLLSEHGELWSLVADLVEAQLAGGTDDADKAWLLELASPLFGSGNDHRGDIEKNQTWLLLSSHPAMRREMLWHLVDQRRTELGGAARVTKLRDLGSDWMNIDRFPWHPKDLAWVVDDIAHRPSEHERQIALDLAISCGLANNKAAMEQVREACAERAEVLARLDKAAEQAARRKTSEKRRAEQAQERRAAQQANVASIKSYLLEHIDELRAGDLELLVSLYRVADGRRRGRTPDALTDLSALREPFGDDVLIAAQDGFIAFWPTFEPWLPHKLKPRNAVEAEARIGLTGLALFHQQGGDWSALSSEQAARATRYACVEWNGFPAWLDELITVHREAVERVFRVVLSANLADARAGRSMLSGLARLSSASADVTSFCAPILIDLLSDPTCPAAFLDSATAVIADAGEPWNQQLSVLALGFLHGAAPELLGTWVPALMATAPEGVPSFITEQREAGTWPPPLEVCAQLTAAAVRHLARADPALIDEFCRLAYVAAATRDDRLLRSDRIGPPTWRDMLRDDRRRLLDMLAQTPRSAPYLRQLAADPLAAPHRSWLLTRAYNRERIDAQPEPWTAERVVDFEKALTSPPRTAAELFAIATARLEDIAHDMERGTFSFREVFWSGEFKDGRHKPVPEAGLQKWVAHELRLRARGQYSVDREPEEDDQKRPDIRLSYGGLGPVSIELKWADNWSVSEMEEAVTTQLVGQYMRDSHARYGILLVARLDETMRRSRWTPRMRLDSLVDHLQGVADQQVREKQLGGVRVCAIDLSPPAGSTARKRWEARRSAHLAAKDL